MPMGSTLRTSKNSTSPVGRLVPPKRAHRRALQCCGLGHSNPPFDVAAGAEAATSPSAQDSAPETCLGGRPMTRCPCCQTKLPVDVLEELDLDGAIAMLAVVRSTKRLHDDVEALARDLAEVAEAMTAEDDRAVGRQLLS